MALKFEPNYKKFKEDYATEKVYTRKDLKDALDAQKKRMTINRVVQSFTGRYGPTESAAMQILAIHETEEGTLVIVK